MKATSKHVLAVTVTTDPTGQVVPLFGFPVDVVKATDAGNDVTFDGAAPSGGTYTTCYRDDVTGEMFEYSERRRGRFVGDTFREIPTAEIDAIDEQTKIAMMTAKGKIPLATAFMKYGDRISGSYFLQSPAKGGSAKAYRLVYEGLRGGSDRPAMALVSKRTARSRQKLVFIYADEQCKCLRMVEVHFAASVREPDALILAPQQAQVEQQQIDLVREIVNALPDAEPVVNTEVDEAVALKEALIDKVIQGEEIPTSTPTPVASSAAATDLMDVLKASLASAREDEAQEITTTA